jgi:hypothetical protein
LKLAIVSVTPIATWPAALAFLDPGPSIAVVATDAIKINARRFELDFILISPATHA